MSEHDAQPLIQEGWRIDYGRRGLSRTPVFLPLADLKYAAQDLEARLCGKLPPLRGPGPPLRHGLTLEQLRAAIAALGAPGAA